MKLTPPVKFLAVGITAVAIDAGVYALLQQLWTVDVATAKAIGFITGAVFAYFANWRFTFGTRRGKFSEVAFVVVYLAALGINVGANTLVIGLLGRTPIVILLAFVIATGASATWNFVGMSKLVFTSTHQKEHDRP